MEIMTAKTSGTIMLCAMYNMLIRTYNPIKIIAALA
jgi:hypothetical protein